MSRLEANDQQLIDRVKRGVSAHRPLDIIAGYIALVTFGLLMAWSADPIPRFLGLIYLALWALGGLRRRSEQHRYERVIRSLLQPK